MSPRIQLYLEASIIVALLAASAAPTPLYAIYQAQWGFSAIAITAVFGVYALAVLAALLTVGSLSDYVGRRPVLVAALALQVLAMIEFATADGVSALVVARIIQGISTGAAAGAVGAGMLDLDRARGTLANAVAPMTGTATGGIVSGLAVQFLPAPMHLIYAVLGAVFVAQIVGVLRMRETVASKAGALASLRPQLRVPGALRAPTWLVVPALVAAWGLVGFYGSLGPTLVRRLAGSQSVALGGLALFVLAASGALSVLATQARSQRVLLAYGLAGLIAGTPITLGSIAASSLALLFVGTAVAGAGFGATFQGALRSVVPFAAAHERAGVLSVLYIVSYLAMGAPAVIAGAAVVHSGDLLATTRGYGLVVIALAAIALAGALLRAQSAARISRYA